MALSTISAKTRDPLQTRHGNLNTIVERVDAPATGLHLDLFLSTIADSPCDATIEEDSRFRQYAVADTLFQQLRATSRTHRTLPVSPNDAAV